VNVPEVDGWVPVTEFARRLGVSRQYVHNLISEGKVKTVHRIGRELVISKMEAVKLLGGRKRGRLIPLDLSDGGVVNLPCERVPELVLWCWDTATGPQARTTFTQTARGLGVPEAAEWSAGRQYIPLNPPDQRGVVSPKKEVIADYLLSKLQQV